MKLSKVGKIGALTSFIASAALAQSTPPSVVGKTCRGTFQLSDATSAKGLGAFQIRFAGTDEKPTAHVWRGFGRAVWQKVDSEVNGGTVSTDLSGFEDLGEAEDLLFQGSQVTMSTRHGGKVVMIFDSRSPSIYDGNGLITTPSPGEPAGRLEWRGATAHVLCR